jgi:single-stranded DNA-binding protein
VTDINKAIIRGRAAADASVKHLTNSTLVTLRIGTDGSYQGKDGRMIDRADWHNVACWGQVGEQAQGIRKGDVVQVEGPIRTRGYGEGANKKWITEIVASKVTVDARDREPRVERNDVPPLAEDDIPF